MATPIWYVGQVKFYDTNKGFGFIKDAATGTDYFVHVSKIDSGPIHDNEIVIYQLRPSRNKPGTFEAAHVWKIARFKANDDFLVAQISAIPDPLIGKIILKALPEERRLMVLEERLSRIILVSTEADYQRACQQLQLVRDLFGASIPKELLSDAISETAYANADDPFKVRFWLDGIILKDLPIDLLRAQFLSLARPVQEKIYSRLNSEQRLVFFETFINIENLSISVNNLFFFLFLDSSSDLQQRFVRILVERIIIVQRLSTEDGIKYYQRFERIIPSLDTPTKELLSALLFLVGPDVVKLKLWLHDHLPGDDYELYHANFVFLSAEEQTRYIKKIFYLLGENSRGINYGFIQRLANLTHSYADGRKYELNFSGNVLLQAIESIRLGTFPTEEAIFYTLTKQVEQDTTALLSLSGFFEPCLGRSSPDQTTEAEDGQKSIVTLQRKGIPRHVSFCEGVKFGGDGKDKIFRHDCWWCRRALCYQPNQDLRVPANYLDYTLSSFLLILDLPFDQRAYVDFLGLLNKINVFVKHLQCRSCGHTLKPTKEGYYSYYRVSNFVCANSNCSNKEIIYLNHCLSGRRTAIKSRCDALIDSRDSRKCNYSKYGPANDYQKYGPYICSECGSCCSQKSLERKYGELIKRNWSMPPGMEWKVVNKVGHLERGEVFCYQCGIEMTSNAEEYQRMIDLLEYPDGTFTVLKNGTSVRGFWYMVRADASFFERARNAGLRVDATSANDPNVRFIAAGKSNLLKCNNCSKKYDTSKGAFVVEELA